MFDLEKAIAKWRQGLTYNRTFTPNDIAELERHLRDHVEGLQSRGLDDAQAFEQAVADMGSAADAQSEYDKIRWPKLRREGRLRDELRWRLSMLENYFKVAIRTLIRRPGSSVLHLVGLSVGMAACMLIGLYVHDELGYDAFHEKSDRIVRVLREFDLPGLQTTITNTPAALADVAVAQIPDVENAARVTRASPVIKRGTSEFVEDGFLIADSTFFDVFTFPLVEGQAALGRPGTIVISQDAATRYFGDDNPVGSVLKVGSQDFEVTGVFSNVPLQSHLQFDFVISLELSADQRNWGINNYATYFLLREGSQRSRVSEQVRDLIRSNRESRADEGDDFVAHLQPLTGIHLGTGVDVEVESSGSLQSVYLFGILAAFILLLACINFMNLATARSLDRSREVGLRKTLGARRSELTGQFLLESIVTTAGAFCFSLILCAALIPWLNRFADKSISFWTLLGNGHWMLILGLLLLTGFVAGSYPALILSSFNPARSLKGATASGGGSRMRRFLVVFQFAVSIVLIACTAGVLQQLHYMQTAGLGYNANDVIIVDGAGNLGDQLPAFEDEARRIAAVESVASGFSVPGTFYINSMWQPDEPNTEAHNLDYSFVDFGYIESLGIDLVAGRSLSREFASDSFAVLLNETAAAEFGWSPEDAVGKSITQGSRAYPVVGVMRDFHFRTLRSKIYPLALFGPRRSSRFVAIRVARDGAPNSIDALEQVWHRFSALPFSYAYLGDRLAVAYASEQQLSQIFLIFSGLAILIACLGLFGLAAFTAEKRTKEIGIRKVLGASLGNVVRLLSFDFLKLVLVSFCVAVPISYIVLQRWLDAYAYRISIGVGVFLVAGGLAVLIAVATVSYQSIRVALTDPVRSLRYE